MQGQQFTMILQSLAQFSAVYAGDGGTKGSGESIAETLQANSASYVFIKSKDKQMIQQLIDMNGKKHVAQESSQSVDSPAGGYRLLDSVSGHNGQGPQVPHITRTTSRDERAVISENDYLRLNNKVTDGNMIVSRGTNPIWSQQSTIMPMGFKLLNGRTGGQGDDIVPKNLPMASDDNNDFLSNIPNVDEMIYNRMNEAVLAPKVIAQYKKVEHKTDLDIQRMDAETFADRIMAGIHANMAEEEKAKKENPAAAKGGDNDGAFDPEEDNKFNEANFAGKTLDEQNSLTDKALGYGDKAAKYIDKHATSIRDRIRASIMGAKRDVQDQISREELKANEGVNEDIPSEDDINSRKIEMSKKIYANNQISKADLIGIGGQITGAEDDIIELAYADNIGQFSHDPQFIVKQGPTGGPNSLYDHTGTTLFVLDQNPDANEPTDRYRTKKEFAQFLAKQDDWYGLAGGGFETSMANYFQRREDERKPSDED